MQSIGVRRPIAGLLFGTMFVLCACAEAHRSADDSEINVYPTNYKPEILAAMHAYLNDPTGIRDPGISAPTLKSVGNNNRYIVCLRFNAKQRGNEYAGPREIAGVFVGGRFDRFAESAREQCSGAAYAPFPELGKLSR